MITTHRRNIFAILFVPVMLQVIIWFVKILEETLALDLSSFGIFPKRAESLLCIFTAPFIHADYKHLISNTFPLFILSLGLFYFYAQKAYRIFFFIFLLEGLGVWLGGREAYHIGASGLVYGLASFVFFAGAFARNKQLAAISLLTVFLYGSMIWGIFPGQAHISWESHLLGFLAGLILAVYYAKPTRQNKIQSDEPQVVEDFSQIDSTAGNVRIIYEYTEKETI